MLMVRWYGVGVNAAELNESMKRLRLSGAGLHRLTRTSKASITRYRNGGDIPPAFADLVRMYVGMADLLQRLEDARAPQPRGRSIARRRR